MVKHISVAGKGGTGKTTFSALLIRYLLERDKTPVLAVDADPNSNLNEALGLELTGTVADILSAAKGSDGVPSGMTRPDFIQYQLHSVLTESRGLDLLVMGGPEGPGCYCFPNEMLKHYLDQLGSGYRYLVMDNEAGLEHLSRRVAQDVDLLVVASDPSVRGIRSAGRVRSLVKNLGIDIERIVLVVCMAEAGMQERLAAEVEQTGLELAGVIPRDRLVVEHDLDGKPLIQLPADSAAWQAVAEIADRLEI